MTEFTVAQRLMLCLSGGLLHFFGGWLQPSLVWGAAGLMVLGLFAAPLPLAVGLGALLGLCMGLESFGVADYGALPVLLMVGSSVVLRIAVALLVAAATRLKQPVLWVVGVTLSFPVVDLVAESSLPGFYVPVALADTQAGSAVTIQIAALGGSFLLTAVMALCGGLVALAVQTWQRLSLRTWLAQVVLAALVPIVTICGGALRLAYASGAPTQEVAHIDVVAIQGGVPNWAYQVSPYVPQLEWAIEDHYFAPTQKIGAAQVDMIIWPETAVRPSPDHLPQILERLKREAQRTQADIVVGLPRRGAQGQLQNAVALVNDQGGVEFVAKRQLVPLLEAEFAADSGPALLHSRVGVLGVLICVESVQRAAAAALADSGAQLLLVVANDAGFGSSRVPQIHAQLAALRAVETGLPVLHVGQFGVTHFYDGYGRRIASSKQSGPAVVVGSIPLTTSARHTSRVTVE